MNLSKVIGHVCYELVLIVSALIMSACSSDTEEFVFGVGYLSPDVVVDGSYTDFVSGGTGVLSVSAYDAPSMTVTSFAGNYSRTWNNWEDYDVKTALSPGKYSIGCVIGNENNEGFSSPWFRGDVDVDIVNGNTTNAAVTCRLANSMVKVLYDDSFVNRFNGGMVKIHSDGGSFLDYTPDADSPIFVLDGSGVLFLEVPGKDGAVTLLGGEYHSLKPCALSGLEVGYTDSGDNVSGIVSLNFKGFNDDAGIEISVTKTMLESKAGELTAYGFDSGQEVETVEGNIPNSAIGVRAETVSLKRLVLSINSGSSVFRNISKEIDLLSDNADVNKLKALGLKLIESSSSIDVDLTGLIASIKFDGNYPRTSFSVYSVSNSGLVSSPVSVSVVTEKPLATVIGTAMCIEGTNTACVEINTDADLTRHCSAEILGENGVWYSAGEVNVQKRDDGNYTVIFDVPSGVEDVKARLLYMGNELVRFDVIRKSPEFDISVDAYALHAVVKILCKDQAYTEYVAENVCVFVNGSRLAVASRMPEKGEVVVAGLNESTKYSFSASIFSSPKGSDYVSPAVTVVTEACSQLPNSDFEDVDKWLNNNTIPSGGRYSQTIVPIFNLQNHTTYTLSVPKKWSNCNSKTFYTASATPNTWYMQPSVFTVTDSHSGAYAVKIQSVAWDNNGAPIADYLQEGQPYVGYSRVIPEISHRASGKLFLGSYQFNGATGDEVYTNGMAFGSRPRALSGFYKYLPSAADVYDRGLVSVELTGLVNGAEVVIGEGQGYLTASGTYKAFSVDIDYRLTNIPAYKLKVMISSSEEVGTIAFESANVKTYSDVVTSTSIGSELWIDELKLSY